jgi:hypothetical protein
MDGSQGDMLADRRAAIALLHMLDRHAFIVTLTLSALHRVLFSARLGNALPLAYPIGPIVVYSFFDLKAPLRGGVSRVALLASLPLSGTFRPGSGSGAYRVTISCE